MLKNLHELDKKLWMKLDIEICGASAAILKNALATEKQSLALKIEGLFKQIRPEFVLNNDELPYSNGLEISQYAFKRYGVKPKETKISQWNEEIIEMIKKPSTIIGNIDYKAGETIESGNASFAANDREYRANLKKDLDNGVDL
jgi:hypothetical protein